MVLGAFLLLYSLFGYVILPRIIQSQAEALISEKLHRHATLGKVDVNPFALAITIRNLKLMEPAGDAVFASFDALTVNLSSESVLRLAPVVQEVRLTRPYLHLVRKDAHRYNVDDLVELASRQPSSQQTARFSVNNIQVEDGRIEFRDQPEKTSHAITELSLGIPFLSSLPSQVNVFVEPLLRAQVDGTPLLIKGKARPFAATRDAVVELNLNGLDLTRYAGYLPFEPRFKLRSALLDTRLSVSFQQPKSKAPTVMLTGGASLKSVQVTGLDGAPMLKLPELAVTLGNVDVLGGHVELAKVVLNGLEADATRDRDGRLSLLRLLPASASTSSSRQATTSAAAPAASAPMHVALEDLEIRNGSLRYADEQSAQPMRASLEKFDLAIRKVAVDTGRKTVRIGEVASGNAGLFLQQGKPVMRPAAAAQAANRGSQSNANHASPATGTSAAYAVRVDRLKIENWSARLEDLRQRQPAVTVVAPLSLSIRDLSTAASSPARIALKATVNKTGQLALSGSLGLAPFHTDLAIDANGVDILPLQPLVADKINLRLTSASLSTQGKLQLDAGEDGALKGGFKGDIKLNNLATVDESSGNDFLRWKSLSLGGMDVRLAPFALTVDNAALTDFFARVIVDSTGRINLQDIAHSDSGKRKSLTETAAVSSTATRPTPAGANTTAVPGTPKRKLPPIRIRKLTFQGGRVRFSDNFIKPNYSASLMNFGGVVTGLSSDPSSTASVDLHGEVNRAPLSIVGRINPLREDLLLDLKANVRGMELAALSPYADRYVGYGIEKGKLSFEVAYHVENRQLSAANRLILNQLTLSEQSTGTAATRLPVKLAIALLQDRNGVIDVNVPIQGSLDDPQFSIGGIILKVIGNAITKAITKPFALLGSLFGNGSVGELSSLTFEPGRAAIPPAAEAKLDSLAKALADRPALKLDITGWADRETDHEGLKRAAIDRKVRALKLKDLRSRGQAAEFGSVTVTADEYPALLARVYKDEDFPKPRNLIGLQKSLPVTDMEKLIMANTVIDDSDLNSLANRRAQAAKDWLLKFGHVPGNRIFILASRSGSRESKEGGGGALNKVEFSLR